MERDINTIATGLGMEPAEDGLSARIIPPDDPEDAYLIRLATVNPGRDGRLLLTVARHIRLEDGREHLTPGSAVSVLPVDGLDEGRLGRLVSELHGWLEAERIARIHARSVSKRLDDRLAALADDM